MRAFVLRGVRLLFGLALLMIMSSLSALAGVSKTPFQLYIEKIEELGSINVASIRTPLPYEVLYEGIQEYCSSDDFQKAEQQFTSFVNDPKNASYFDMNRPASLGTNFLKTKNTLLALEVRNDTIRCRQTIFLLKTMQKLQSGQAQNSLVHIAINNDMESLSARDQAFGRLAEYFIRARIAQLVQDKILDTQDLSRIDGKITIDYTKTCGMVNGNYKMLVSSTGTKQVTGITVTVNLCNAIFYTNNFQAYMDHIITHELGHYVYYFKDTTTAQFDALCRSQTKNSCARADFVSEYAQKMKEEDYAESFAYWYLVAYERRRLNDLLFGKQSSKPAKFIQKLEHFKIFVTR